MGWKARSSARSPDPAASLRRRVVQTGKVCEVARASRGALVGLEIVEMNDWQLDPADVDHVAPWIAVLEPDAIDAGQQIDSPRWVPELHHCVGGREVGRLHLQGTNAERCQRRESCSR